MTDKELWAAAWAELTQSTISYPKWKQQGFTRGHWAAAKALGDQIGAVTPPPSGVAAPVGPLVDRLPLFLRDTGNVTTEKIRVLSSPNYGIGNMAWPATASTGVWTLRDCIVQDVAASPPRSMDGTGEAGFWIGQRTNAARLLAKRCAWMGMWTGAKCDGSVIEDFQLLEMPHIGLYVEHVTSNTTFRRFSIHSVDNGINIEWWYGGVGSHDLLFEDGDVYCAPGATGIFADAGTYGCTFRNIRFWGPGSAIALPNKMGIGGRPNVVENCVFENTGSHVTYHDNAIG